MLVLTEFRIRYKYFLIISATAAAAHAIKGGQCAVTLWKPRKNGSATTVSMTSNRTSLEVAAAEAGTTKRAEAGRIVIARVGR